MSASRGSTIRHNRRRDRRERADVSQFAALIASLEDLGEVADTESSTELQLPANARLGISFSVAIDAGEFSLSIGETKSLGTPDLVADRVYKPGVSGEEGQAIVVNRDGAPAGTATVHLIDGIGRAFPIATATFT